MADNYTQNIRDTVKAIVKFGAPIGAACFISACSSTQENIYKNNPPANYHVYKVQMLTDEEMLNVRGSPVKPESNLKRISQYNKN